MNSQRFLVTPVCTRIAYWLTHPRVAAVTTTLIAVSLAPNTVAAQLLPLGPEFQINGISTDNDLQATVAPAPAGGFIVSWSGFDPADEDAGEEIFARRVGADGQPVGAPFIVNAYSTDYQYRPSVAAASSGDFVVVWDGANTPLAGGYGVVARAFSSTGAPLGAEFSLGAVPGTANGEEAARVAVLPNDDFVAVWTTRYPSDVKKIRGRRFQSDGTLVGAAFDVGEPNSTYHHQLAADSSGDFLVVWNAPGLGVGASTDVFARGFDSTGTPISSAFVVNSYTTGYQRAYGSHVAALSAGGFAVSWFDYETPGSYGSTAGVRARRIEADGTALGASLLVVQRDEAPLYWDFIGDAHVAASPTGNFVVAWTGNNDVVGARHGGAREYDSTGSPVGSEFVINADTSQTSYVVAERAESGPRLAFDANGTLAALTLVETPGLSERVRTFCSGDRDLDGVCDTVDTCPDDGAAAQTDGDSDGAGDACDNCVGDANPGQQDSDADGAGDACDDCPADAGNTCDPANSASEVVGPGGGSVANPSGTVAVDLPAGAVGDDTPIAISDVGAGDREFLLTNQTGTRTLHRVVLTPEDAAFSKPVAITFGWTDGDDDGLVDNGLCDDGVTPCSSNATCTALGKPTPCRGEARLPERNMKLKKDGLPFGGSGECSGNDCKCEAHVPTCADDTTVCTSNADCSGAGAPTPCDLSCDDATAADAMGNCTDPDARVAKCCNPVANTWEFETCGFSEFFLGETEGDLIPGKGSPATDCIAEFKVLNSSQSPSVDKKGLTNFKQECTDGDPQCDADGQADGQCTFAIGFCVNVEDDRLAKGDIVLCAPTDVEQVRMKKPRPLDPNRPVDEVNGQALRTVLAALGAHTIEGRREDILTYDTPITELERCTELADFVVPLKNSKGKGKIKLQFVTSEAAGEDKDSDGLKLTCLAAD